MADESNAKKEKEQAPAEQAEKAAPEQKKQKSAAAKDAAAGDAAAKQDEQAGEETAASLLDSNAAPIKRVKIKGSKNITTGIVHITATFNNTIVSISDARGNVISWSTAGRCGFKGSRKSTAFAATTAAQEAARTAINHGLQEVEVRVQGPGAGRESAVRAIQAAGITVTAIRDMTPIPHNGCRARKRRRV